MLTLIAILAFVSVPYALYAYFNSPRDSQPAGEECAKVGADVCAKWKDPGA